MTAKIAAPWETRNAIFKLFEQHETVTSTSVADALNITRDLARRNLGEMSQANLIYISAISRHKGGRVNIYRLGIEPVKPEPLDAVALLLKPWYEATLRRIEAGVYP